LENSNSESDLLLNNTFYREIIEGLISPVEEAEKFMERKSFSESVIKSLQMKRKGI
jgi:hypothetical protein